MRVEVYSIAPPNVQPREAAHAHPGTAVSGDLGGVRNIAEDLTRSQKARAAVARDDATGPVPRSLGAAAAAWYSASEQAEKAKAWDRFGQDPGAQAVTSLLETLHDSPWGRTPRYAAKLRGWLERMESPEHVELRRSVFAISHRLGENLDAAKAPGKKQ